MTKVDFVHYSWDVPYRFRALASALLRRIADENNVSVHVRTVAEDPDPPPTDPSAAPSDPVRFADDVTLPPNAVNLLRQAATSAGVHIYVHPPTHELG